MPREHVMVVAILLVSTFVAILNETTVGVALPAIMDEFGVSAATGQWLLTAFLLTMSIIIPTTGWILGRLGTRGGYLLAMGLFSVGTLAAAFAPSFAILLAARVVQASGTAILFPLLMTTVMTLVPPMTRGRVMGNVSLVISAAPALGPTMSGAVIGAFGWRWVFGVILPIALVAFALGAVYVRNTAERTHSPLDILSVLLAVGAFGGLVYGMSSLGEGEAIGIFPAWVPVVVGALFLAAFIARQIQLQKDDRALLDLRVFRSRGFSVALGILATGMIALFGVIILLPLFLQDVLGLDPLHTGLTMLPGALIMGLLSPTVGRLYDKVGPRPLVVPGLVLVAAGLTMLAFVDAGSSSWRVLAAHVVMSLGLAFVFTPLFTTALSSVRPSLVAHGSATIGTVQQLAGAAGTAVFVAIMSARSSTLVAEGVGETAALAGGVRASFTVGAVVAVVALVAAVLLRRPDEDASTEDREDASGADADDAGRPDDTSAAGPAAAPRASVDGDTGADERTIA
ncbi:DHA2 family efflux MFS transporter permease subunit [Paraoerskovia marina]|nr:DHA2 family efflux MFS transporter permease subunit [Paraoerskovia marina]